MVVGYLKNGNGHFEEDFLFFGGGGGGGLGVLVVTGCNLWDSFYLIRCMKHILLLAMLLIDAVTEFGESGRVE